MTKPSLSFYTNIPTPYQESFFKELAKIFTLKVIYYSITEKNRDWQFSLPEGYEVIVLKDNFIARVMHRWIVDFHFSWRIFLVSLKDKSDYIVVGGGYWIPNSVVAMLFNKIKSKKIAYFSETLFPAKSKLVFILKCFSLGIVNMCCKAVFCVGKMAVKSFEHFKVNVQKFTILYNIDPLPFDALNGTKVNSYKERYKSRDEIIILSSGSLIDRKGMDILIKGVQRIKFVNVRLLVIGDGPKRNQLNELAGNDDRIIFAGFQKSEEVPYFFAIADIFSLASRYDGWGVVINEAIAANVPIVSSDKVGAAVEFCSFPNTIITCESDNVDAFKVAIESLMFDYEKRQIIKTNMKNLVPLISSEYNAQLVYDIFINQLN